MNECEVFELPSVGLSVNECEVFELPLVGLSVNECEVCIKVFIVIV